MAKDQIKFGIGFDVDESGLNQIKRSFDEIKKITPTLLKDMNPGMTMNEARSEYMKMQNTIREVDKAFQDAFNPSLGVTNIKKLNQSLNNIGIEKLSNSFSKFGTVGTKTFQDIATKALTTNVQFKQSNELLNEMAKTMTNTIKWGISSRIMNEFSSSVQQAWGYVKHLDTSLNDIRIVTGKSADEMARFAEIANKSAKNLGASTTEYTEAALIYYQQGLGDEEAQARADTTVKAANVTGQETAEVSEQLTAVWNGYKASASEAELYVDKLAAVAATTAADLEELSTGMSKVASAANIMGVDIDQLNAQLATVVSVTRQAPESVGTAFKTIYARMGDIEAGIDTETTLGNYTAEMEAMGINVLDAEGNLRDMGEVIEEIGGKWSSMTREQQISLSQTMAGTRQYNNLLSLFDNWDMYTDALNTSADAAGTLNEQNEIYLESTEAHLQQLSTAMEGIYDSLLNPEAINNVIDMFTGLAGGVETFIDAIGGGRGAIIGLGAIVQRVFGKQIAGEFTRLQMNFAKSVHNSQELKAQLDMLNKFKIASAGDEIVQAMVEAKIDAQKYYEYMDQEQREQVNNIINEIKEAKELEVQWKENAEAVNEYVKAVGLALSSNNKANTEKYQKYDIRKTPTENITFNKTVHGHLDKSNELVNQLQDSFKDLKVKSGDAFNLNKLKGFKKELNKQKDFYKSIGYDVDALTEKIDKYIEASKKGENRTKGMKEIEQMFEKTSEQVDKTRNKVSEMVPTLEDVGDRGGAAVEHARQKLDQLLDEKKLQVFNEGLVRMGAGFTEVLYAVQDIQNIGNIWNNDNLSDGEKFVQTLIAVSTILKSSISAVSDWRQGWQNVKEMYEELSPRLLEFANMQLKDIAAKKADAVATGELAAAEATENTVSVQGAAIDEAQTAGQAKQGVAVKVLAKRYWELAKAQLAVKKAKLGLIAVAGVAAISISVLIARALKHKDALSEEEKELKRTNEAIEQAKNQLSELASGYSELKSAISDYQSAYDALAKLTKGTQEWKDAILETNDKALELMRIYPELAGAFETNKDGILELQTDSDDYQKFINKRRQGVEASQQLLLQTQIDNAKAKQQVAIEENFIGNDSDRTADELTLYKAEHPDSWNMDISHDDIEKIAKVATEIDGGLASLMNMSEYELGEVGITTRAAIDAIHSNSQELQNVIDAYRENQLAIDSYTQALVNSIHYQGEEEDSNADKAIVKAYVGGLDGTGTSQYEYAARNRAVDIFGNDSKINSDEEAKAYFDAFGYDYTDIKYDKEEKKIKYKTAGSDEWQDEDVSDISQEEVVSAIAKVIASNDEDIVEKATEELEKVTGGNEALKRAIIATVTNDFTEMTQDEALELLEKYGNLDIDWQYLADAFFQGEIDRAKDAIESTINTRASLNDDEAERQKRLVYADSNADSINTSAKGLIQTLNEGNEIDTSTEEYQKWIEQINELKTIYPELTRQVEILNDEAAIGTDSYIAALNDVQDALSAMKIEAEAENAIDANTKVDEYLNNIENAADGATTVTLDVAMDDEEFQQSMDELMGANYSIDVELHAEGIEEFEHAEDMLNDVSEAASKIGDSFIIAGDDARELNNSFPGILENCIYLADGTIQLNEEVAKSAMEAGNMEAEAATQAAIAKIQSDQKALKTKAAIYKHMAEMAYAAAEDEQFSAEATAEIQADLDKLDIENSKAVAEAKIDDDFKVAETSGDNAEAYGNNWVAAYQQINEALKQYAKNKDHVDSGKKPPLPYDQIEASYGGGSSGVSAAASGLREGASAAIKLLDQNAVDTTNWTQLGDYYNSFYESTQASIADMDGMIAELLAKGSGNFDELAKTGKAATSEMKDPDFIDYLDEEIDKFHNVTVAIKEVDTALGKLSRTQEKLYGQDLLDNLNEQLGYLEAQKDLYEEKIKLVKEEASNLQGGILSTGNVRYDENSGRVMNYNEAIQTKKKETNDIIEAYNKLSAAEQEAYKPTVEAAQAEYEQFKSALDEYETLVQDTLPELEEQWQAATDQEIEIQIKKFTMAVEIQLDLSEAQREWNKFRHKVLLGDDESVLGKGQQDFDDVMTYLDTGADDGKSSLVRTTEQVNKTLEQLKQIEETGTSSVYGDNQTKALEDLETYSKELMTELEDIDSLVDSIEKGYVDAIKEAKEAMDKQVEDYEFINKLVEHNISLVEKLRGEDAYSDLAEYYKIQNQNNMQELDMYRQEEEFFRKKLEDVEQGTEAWKEYYANWKDAVEGLNSISEKALDDLIKEYSNKIKGIFDDLDKSMSNGVGTDFLAEEWELINKNADQYLDTVNATYEVQALQDKYLTAIKDADSTDAQKKLNSLMEDELSFLEEKDKLTQYDIDRANKRYEIALKQIALEEAQQNKSSMRLKRDSQGNYTYVYGSDQDDIAAKQQELAAAQNELYNMDKEQYQQNLDDMLQAYRDFQEAYIEITNDITLSDEEKIRKQKLLEDEYSQYINGLATENAVIRENLNQSAYDLLDTLYQNDQASFEAMVDLKTEEWKNMTSEMLNDMLINLIPGWDGGIQSMIDKITGEGGFQESIRGALLEAREAENQFEKAVESANLDLSVARDTMNQFKNVVEQYMPKNTALIQDEGKKLQAYERIRAELQRIQSQYAQQIQSAKNAAIAANQAASALKNQAIAAASVESAIKKVNIALEQESGKINDLANRYQRLASAANSASRAGASVSTRPNSSNSSGRYTEQYFTSDKSIKGIWDNATGNWAKIGVTSQDKKRYGLASGGYTGEWSGGSQEENGKLAFLHQKELVLNESDTANILSAVDTVRSMSSIFSASVDNSVGALIGSLISAIDGFNQGSYIDTSSSGDTIEQTVHITAEFKDATDSRSIQEALLGLTNTASQYANKNSRHTKIGNK